MTAWQDDNELFDLVRSSLYTAVVGDILDTFECYHQFLPQPIQPLEESMVVVGRAMPVLQMDVFGEQEQPYGLMTRALDDLRAGEVYVATGGSLRGASWGELMTAAARSRGAVGAVVDAYHRDTPMVLAQSFPVFSRGRYAQDSGPRTKVVDYRSPIEIDGVWVAPGDLVFGDLDGVVIVPRHHEEEVIEKALEKASRESEVRKDIEGGMSATDAFEKYGIL